MAAVDVRLPNEFGSETVRQLGLTGWEKEQRGSVGGGIESGQGINTALSAGQAIVNEVRAFVKHSGGAAGASSKALSPVGCGRWCLGATRIMPNAWEHSSSCMPAVQRCMAFD